jgi:hypothetical protein
VSQMERHTRLPVFILAGAVAVVMHRLFLGESLFWGLPALQFFPWRLYGFALIRDLTLPLWNPYNGAGAPLLANYQSAFLYPPNWVGLMPISNAALALIMSAVVVFHLVLAGWGMWRLGIRIGLSPLGAGVSGIAFGMSAYLFARLHTFPIISAAAWLPWLLWALYGLLTVRRVRDGGWTALFVALLLLAGHAQTAWYALLLAGLFTVWTVARIPPLDSSGLRLIGYRDTLWRRSAPLLAAAGCVLVGIGAASAQLLPTAELLMQSGRADGVETAFALNYSYAPARALNLIAPNIFGTPADGSYYTEGAYFEDAVYVGIIPLFLALSAVLASLRRRRDPQRPDFLRYVPFAVGLILIGFVFALGRYTPIFPFLYDYVPTFDMFQAPVRWHLWTVVGLCILAGIGASVWERSFKARRRARLGLAASVGTAAVLVVTSLLVRDSAPTLPILINALIIMFIMIALLCALIIVQPEANSPRRSRWSALVLLVAASDLAAAAWGLNPTVPSSFYDPLPDANISAGRGYWSEDREREVKFDLIFRFDDYRIAADGWAAARQSGLPNLNLLDRTYLLNNFDPLLPAPYLAYVNLIETSENPRKLLRAAGVDRAFDLGELMAAPRAWLVDVICWHADESALIAAIADPAWNPDTIAHALGDGGCPQPGEGRVGEIRRLNDIGSQVVVELEANRDAWLIVADSDYPGWTAAVNGEPTYIYRANLAFRAVQVPAGMHTVEFAYRPWWMLAGAFVSVVSLLGILLMFRIKPITGRD